MHNDIHSFEGGIKLRMLVHEDCFPIIVDYVVCLLDPYTLQILPPCPYVWNAMPRPRWAKNRLVIFWTHYICHAMGMFK
jgi:hypothetical protein